MDQTKASLIASSDTIRDRRRPEPYRPFSVRWWVLLLYVALTAGCFGLLMTVSLIERRTNQAIQKVSKRSGTFGDINERADPPYFQTHTLPNFYDSKKLLSLTTGDVLPLAIVPTGTVGLTSPTVVNRVFSTNQPTAAPLRTTVDPPTPTPPGATTAALISLTQPRIVSTTTEAQISLTQPPILTTTTKAQISLTQPIVTERPSPTETTKAQISLTQPPLSTTRAQISLTQTAILTTTTNAQISLTEPPITTTKAQISLIPPPTTTTATPALSETSRAQISLTEPPVTTTKAQLSLTEVPTSVKAQISLTAPFTTQLPTPTKTTQAQISLAGMPTVNQQSSSLLSAVPVLIPSSSITPAILTTVSPNSLINDQTLATTPTLNTLSSRPTALLPTNAFPGPSSLSNNGQSASITQQLSQLGSSPSTAAATFVTPSLTSGQSLQSASISASFIGSIYKSSSSTVAQYITSQSVGSSGYSYMFTATSAFGVSQTYASTSQNAYYSLTSPVLGSSGGQTLLASVTKSVQLSPYSVTGSSYAFNLVPSSIYGSSMKTTSAWSFNLVPSQSSFSITQTASNLETSSDLFKTSITGTPRLKTITPNPSSTTSSGASGSSSSASSTSARYIPIDPVVTQNLVVVKKTWQQQDYFFALYLPKIIAVIMTALWGVILATLRLMEPFYQLSARDGALAKDTFFGNYLSSDLSPSSISATVRGQWVLIFGAAIMVTWAAIVATISEFSLVISTADCPSDIPGEFFRCAPVWVVNRTLLYVLMVLVGLNLVMVSALALIMIQRQRRRTGVYADPSSIASMNELLGNQFVLEDFRRIHANDTKADVKIKLGDNRYKLGFYDPMNHRPVPSYEGGNLDDRWGLIKVMEATEPKPHIVRRHNVYKVIDGSQPENVEERRANKKRRIYSNVYQGIMLLTTICILILIWIYWKTSGNDPLNLFLNNPSGFGPRFVMTGLALILSVGWRRTSQEITLHAPYRSMGKSIGFGVKAEHSLLASTACTPYTAFSRSIRLRNPVIALAALSAMLGDILLISISGVPLSVSQTMISLLISFYLSVAILCIMAISSVCVIVYNRMSAGGTRKIPRSPDTLIGVWLYLCGSTLSSHTKPEDDEPMILDDQGLQQKYANMYHRYAFAPVRGVDDVDRWTIDTVDGIRTGRQKMIEHRHVTSRGGSDAQAERQTAEVDEHQDQTDESGESHQTRQPSAASSQYSSSQYSFQPSVDRMAMHHSEPEVPVYRSSTRRKPVPGYTTVPQQQQDGETYDIGYSSADYTTERTSPRQGAFESLRHKRHTIAEEPEDVDTNYDRTERPFGRTEMTESQRQVEEENLMPRSTLSIHTRTKGVWMNPNEYRKYGN